LPLAHAAAFVHALPFCCFATHTFPLHHASLAQSASCAQLEVHAAFTHWNGSQLIPVGTCVHVPAPLHSDDSTDVPTHAFAPHFVFAGANAVPLHIARSTPSHCGVAHAVPAGHAARAP
jgi:hypothetical protein